MTIMEAIKNRHSVRAYLDKRLEESAAAELEAEIKKCNAEAGLAIQLITGDQDVFTGILAHYGGFRNVSSYIALVGPEGGEAEEKLGYYGEHLVLKAQQMGLNTCWVAATYKKGKCRAVIGAGQKLACVIALGYGQTQGRPRRTKPMEQLCQAGSETPEWFRKGMEAAMLAPTAMNKQSFQVILEGDAVRFEYKPGKYSRIDLGIVKYHFQKGAGLDSL